MGINNNKQFLIKTLVIIGFWIILAVISIIPIFSEPQISEKHSWIQIVFRFGLRWFIWIILTPIILWLSDTFSLERKKWKRSAAIHLVLSVIFALVYSILYKYSFHLLDNAASSGIVRFRALSPTEIFFYWGLLGISHSIKYYSMLRDREMQSLRLEKELSDAKLHFLKSQLHPHFLFNTMHTIANLIRDESYHKAIEMISGFSELLRLSLDNLNTQTVSLKEESDYLDLYLNIEKIRFKDRLRTEIKIPPEVLSCKVPFLLLQPFVENSIKHGLIKNEDSLLIRISASRNNNNLAIEIEDDGPGFPDGWSFEKNSGIGLRNIHRRLSTIYGGNFAMELQNSPHSGATVTLVIPFSRAVE